MAKKASSAFPGLTRAARDASKQLRSVADMVRHIDYVANRVGVDYVGIGNDYNHGGGRIGGLADASDSLNVTEALVERGYDAEAIAKIWGGNFMRVLGTVEAT